MFLLCKIAFDICKKMGLFRVTFLATELRVIEYVLRFFGKQNCQCPVATIGKFPLLESPEGLLSRPVSTYVG